MDYRGAEALCRELLAQDGGDADAHKIAGFLAYQRGDHEHARSCFERAIELRPEMVDAWISLGKVSTQRGDADAAERAYNEAIRLEPGCLAAIEAEAELFTMAGRIDDAKSLLAPIIDSPKESARAALILATIERQSGRLDEAMSHIRRHVESPATPTPIRRRMLFELGRALDEEGRTDEAFAAFARGNTLEAQPFDIRRHEEGITEIITVFSKKNFKLMRRAALTTTTPVFVTGMARSGTTLVEQIIDAHPNAVGAGELSALPRVVTSIPELLHTQVGYPRCAERLTPKGAALLGSAYLDFIAPVAPGAARTVDKTLRVYPYIGLLNLMLPGAAVIHCRRHPIDTCLSCFMADLDPVKHPYIADLRTLGLYRRQYERLMEHWRTIGVEMLEVEYEELVACQESQSRRIIEHIALPWDDRCLRFHESGRLVRTLSFDQVRRPIYTSAVDRWKRYDKHLGALREGLAGRC